jgi:DNA-binding transcriptional LysR family regulator
VAPYRWEYTEDGRDFDVAVEPRVATNDMAVMVHLACSGADISFGMEETFRPYLDRGELVSVLEQFLPSFPGFFLFFPQRQQQPAKLRALIDHLKSAP